MSEKVSLADLAKLPHEERRAIFDRYVAEGYRPPALMIGTEDGVPVEFTFGGWRIATLGDGDWARLDAHLAGSRRLGASITHPLAIGGWVWVYNRDGDSVQIFTHPGYVEILWADWLAATKQEEQ